MSDWWRFEELESGHPYDWSPSSRNNSEWDQFDFHLDLGCGTVPKGRLGIDRYYAPGVDLLIDLDNLVPAIFSAPGVPIEENSAAAETSLKTVMLYDEMDGWGGLPFPDDSIESIISHHTLEHIGSGFLPLMDECYRILKPGAVFRIIVPLFPSYSAVADPDHKRYFMEETFDTFCGDAHGNHWMQTFSIPYTNARFQKVDEDFSPPPRDPSMAFRVGDAREIRVALRKWGGA